VDLLEKPFQEGGRGPHQYDCYGVVREMMRRSGSDLPDYPTENSDAAVGQLITEMQRGWVPAEGLKQGTVVYLVVAGSPHVGYMLDERRFIHIVENGGVSIAEVEDQQWKKRVKGFYRWTRPFNQIERNGTIDGLEIIRVLNPLDPTQRTRDVVPLLNGNPLSSYVPKPKKEELVILEGKVLEAREMDSLVPKPGDQVIIAPKLESRIARIAAFIGVAALAAFVGPLVGGLLGALIGAGISIGGGLLINLLLPPPKLSPREDTQVFGWDGPQLTSRQGIPIPKGYGILRVAGNVISSYIETYQEKQFINVLICFGHGPVFSITAVEVNGNPIKNYRGVFAEKRFGQVTQNSLLNFSQIVTESLQGTTATVTGGPVTVVGTRTDTQSIEVELFFPRGIFDGPNKKGKFNKWTVWVNIESKLSAAAPSAFAKVLKTRTRTNVSTTVDWTAVSIDSLNTGGEQPLTVLATDTGAGAHQEGDLYTDTINQDVYEFDDITGDETLIGSQAITVSGVWISNPLKTSLGDNLPGILVEQSDTWITTAVQVSGSSPKPIRHVVRINNLAADKYDIRVTKLGSSNEGSPNRSDNNSTDKGEQVILASIREFADDALNYPGLALLGVRALATDQLQGRGINITVLLDYGDPVLEGNPTTLGTFTGDNPAVIAWDLMTNVHYGAAVLPADCREADFVAWANFSNEVVDDGESGTEFRFTFNGLFDTEGSTWDAIRAVAQMSRAAVVRVGTEYRVVLDKAANVTQMFNIANMEEDSFKETFYSALNRANSLDVQFVDSTENYRRNVITVERDPNVLAGTDTDKGPTLDLFGVTKRSQAVREAEYRIIVNEKQRKGIEFSADVDAIACTVGDVIKVQHDITKWGDGGRIVSAASTTVVTLDQQVVIGAGTHELLIRNSVNDDIEIRTVTTLPSTTDVITVSVAFSFTPQLHDLYMVGLQLAPEDFRLVRIRKAGDHRRALTAVQYDPTQYTDVDPVIPGSPGAPTFEMAVTNLTAREEFQDQEGQGPISFVNTGWVNGKTTVGGRIFIAIQAEGSTTFSPEELVVEIAGVTSYRAPAQVGDIWRIRVVGFDLARNVAPISTAPTVTLEICGQIEPQIWHPGIVTPAATDPLFAVGDQTFQLEQKFTILADGTALATLDIRGFVPVVDFIPLTGNPTVGTISTNTTGGSLEGGKTYYTVLTAKDANGNLTPPSCVRRIVVPAGTSTNTVELGSIVWPAGTFPTFEVWAADDEGRITLQTETTAALPSSISILGPLKRSQLSLPSFNARLLKLKVKTEFHAGPVGTPLTGVGTNQLVAAALIDPGGDDWNGRDVSVIGSANGGILPLWNFNVTAYVDSTGTFTVTPDPSAAGVMVGDALIIRTEPGTVTPTTIEDPKWINVLAPTGFNVGEEVGRYIRIVAGKGVGQVRKIVANTSVQLTIDKVWDVTPDSSTRFIVEAASWEFLTESSPIQAAVLDKEIALLIQVANFAVTTVLIKAILVDKNGREGDEVESPFREVFIFGEDSQIAQIAKVQVATS